MSSNNSAPIFSVPKRKVVALEHPMIVKNIDNGLKTFGTGAGVTQILDTADSDSCIPLYLRVRDPMCAPILSHNTPTNDVLISITLPKRTGRKRKRGSNDPYTSLPTTAVNEEANIDLPEESASLCSHSRLDKPKDLREKLRDNIGRYQVQAIGAIEHTHRYRGLSDYTYSTTHGSFMTKFRDTILTGSLESMKAFKLNPSKGVRQNEELIPPPSMTDHPLPFNWGYHQNRNIKEMTDEITGQKILVNQSAPAKVNTAYVAHNVETVPDGPPEEIPHLPDDATLRGLVIELRQALEERPIWTRRAILNRVSAIQGFNMLKPAVQYVGYQFRGGPWRDAIIRYGVDPRTDPKYRFYQTLFFKIFDETVKTPGQPWQDVRSEYTRKVHLDDLSKDSHIFDGKSVSLDGKIWQVCDITDPLLKRVLATERLREKCDTEIDGWYCNGTWGKVKAIMRTKISAIRIGREMADDDFAKSLAVPDHVNDKIHVTVPVPDWRVDHEQSQELADSGLSPAITVGGLRRRRIRGRIGKNSKSSTTLQKDGTPLMSFMSTPSGKDFSTVGPSPVMDPRIFEAMEGLQASDDLESLGRIGELSTPDDLRIDGAPDEEENDSEREDEPFESEDEY